MGEVQVHAVCSHDGAYGCMLPTTPEHPTYHDKVAACAIKGYCDWRGDEQPHVLDEREVQGCGGQCWLHPNGTTEPCSPSDCPFEDDYNYDDDDEDCPSWGWKCRKCGHVSPHSHDYCSPCEARD
jgi:hypothetical protein